MHLITAVRKLTNLAKERGQALILFVLLFTVILAVGAAAVDFGIWWSERRGAQTDADLSALAGAWELLGEVAGGGAGAAGAGSCDGPVAAAECYLEDNDEQGNASLAQPVLVDDSCFPDGIDDAVTVDVNHASRSLFAGIFGVGEPDIGAHAKACAGAIYGMQGIVPIEIDNNGPCFDADEVPVFTRLCALEYGAQGGNPRGILDLHVQDGGDECSDNQGSGGPPPGGIYQTIITGSTGRCEINETGSCGDSPWYDCVAVQTGNARRIVEAFHDRIQQEGSCDDDNSGVEEFDEIANVVVDTGDPATSIYEARICPNGKISPRAITIIVLDEDPDPGNTGRPIDAFAGFYVSGCYISNDDPPDPPDLDPECVVGSQVGHAIVYGNFMNIVVAGGDIGAPNDSTTIFGISLVE